MRSQTEKFRKLSRRPKAIGSVLWLRPLIWLVVALVVYAGVVTWLLPMLVKMSGGRVLQNYHGAQGLRSTSATGDIAGPSTAVAVVAPGAVVATGSAAGFVVEDSDPLPPTPIVEPVEYFFAVDGRKVKVLDHYAGNLFSWWTGITGECAGVV